MIAARAGRRSRECNVARAAFLGLTTLLLACTSGDSGTRTLTVYSPHGRDLLTLVEQRFEAANAGVDLQFIDMGSQEILDRLRSERANPQADVWFGAPATMFETGAADSLLERSSPTWADALDATARDDAGFWHGTYITPEVIAYNTEAVPADQAPRDWDDVLDPRWKGKVLIRDPLASGTMRTIFGMIIDRSVRRTGDTKEGFAWLQRLDAQTKEYVLNPTLLYNKLARQEGLITLWDMPDIEELRGKSKLPIDYVLPSSGTPLVVEGIAVVRGSKQPQLARALIEYVGGIPGLTEAARNSYRLPARKDFPADSLSPRVRAARAHIVPEPINWQLLQEKTPEWMRYWDENIRGRSAR
jgi:iron(III) transport system substrate-binding protein